jgi:sugar/nucleoside kinase (ribokinase family)
MGGGAAGYANEPVDYLAVGHICRDLTPTGPRPGGTVAFAALTAAALGLRVGIVTSLPADAVTDSFIAPLEHIALARHPADAFTTFRNEYDRSGARTQTLAARAATLGPDDVPAAWRRAAIVHLAPVADEVAPTLLDHVQAGLVGITPQGWMRAWDEAGQVSFRPWPDAGRVLRAADAVVLGIEDVAGDEALVELYAAQARLLIVTRGAAGCTLHWRGQAHAIPAPRVRPVVDPTGAGDIFAAAFFCRLRQTPDDPLGAARFATQLASASVTRAGLGSIPTPEEIEEALRKV